MLAEPLTRRGARRPPRAPHAGAQPGRAAGCVLQVRPRRAERRQDMERDQAGEPRIAVLKVLIGHRKVRIVGLKNKISEMLASG